MADPIPVDLAASLYGEKTPCIMQLTSGQCQAGATHLLKMTHDDGSLICQSPEWLPACSPHKDVFEQVMTGFWAAVLPTKPPCMACGKRIVLSETREINLG